MTAALVYGCLATAATWFAPLGHFGGLLLIPFLLCPGYAVARAIEGRSRRGDALELGVIAVTLSFATAALGGLLLNLLGIALTDRSWSVLILAVTGIGVAAQWATGARASDRRFGLSLPRRSTMAMAVVTVGLLVAAGSIAWHSEQRLNRERSVTQLAAMREPGPRGAIRVSVRNAERATRRFRLQITAGKQSKRFTLTLAPGARWSVNRRAGRSSRTPVTVRLFRAGETGAAIRSVTLR